MTDREELQDIMDIRVFPDQEKGRVLVAVVEREEPGLQVYNVGWMDEQKWKLFIMREFARIGREDLGEAFEG